jgi:vancomycin resistance protein YoaR
MSDHRRSSSRKCVTRKYEASLISKQIQNENKTTKKSRKVNNQTSSDLSRTRESPNLLNKRTRLDSATSKKLNQKKKKQMISDDDEIQEILPEKKGLFISKQKKFNQFLSFL